MLEFLPESNIFIIDEDLNIRDFTKLQKAIYSNIKKIKVIKLSDKVKIDNNIMYLLSCLKSREGIQLDLPANFPSKLKEIAPILLKPRKRLALPDIEPRKILQILNIFAPATPKQNLFWWNTFSNIVNLCFFQNFVFFCSAMTYGGFATILLARHVFIKFYIENKLPEIVCSAWVCAAAPMLTCIMIMAKFSTATSAMIKFKGINNELNTLRCFGINAFTDYMNPIVFGCVASGVMMNFFCTLASLFGAALAWKISGYSLYMYFELTRDSITLKVLSVSFLKVLFSSFWLGLMTCLGGLTRGQSVVSIFLSVEKMIIWAFWGMAVIQISLSFLLI